MPRNKTLYLSLFLPLVLLVLFLSTAAMQAASFHTILIDGVNDFAADEEFTTSSGSYAAYATWDANNLYLGYAGGDIGSGESSAKWMVWYIDADPHCGPNGGNGSSYATSFNSQNWALPFKADYFLQIRTDEGLNQLNSWNGASWTAVTYTGAVFDNDGANFIELRLPLTDIGSPERIRILGYFINEQNLGEWTYASWPAVSLAGGDGYNRFGAFYNWYEFALVDSMAPNAPANFSPAQNCAIDDSVTEWAIAAETGAGSGAYEVGPGAPPAGVGSARLTTPAAADGQVVGTFAFAGVRLADIDALAYATYRASGAAILANALQLNLDFDLTDTTTGWQGRLVYEPYQQSPSPTIPDNTWQTWNTINGGNGRWWASAIPVDNLCGHNNPCAWNTFLAAYPNAGINFSLPGFLAKAGSNWAGFSGHVDNIAITINDAAYTFDLEPYFPVHNITQNTDHLTIQAGINAANPGDVLEIDPGTYVENVVANRSITLRGAGDGDNPAEDTILNGSTLTGMGIRLNNGITGVTIEDMRIVNYGGVNPSAGIYGNQSNHNLTIQNVTVNGNGPGFISASGGVVLNGPIDNVLIDNVTAHNNWGRGIVIWNGFKSNITITNNDVRNNNCCGIELQDGTAAGVTMTGNTVVDNADSGMAAVGLMAGAGANVIANNVVTDNGRFGIEIKLPNGTGLDSGDGSMVVENNTVSRTFVPADARDLAGIAVFRRGWLTGNVDIPTGVIVRNNSVSGYRQTTTSDGFGIVVEGANMTVTDNTLTNNDVGVQLQAGHLPYTANTNIDGNQNNLADQYFGRGNSPVGCAAILSNTFSGNGVNTRNVGPVGGGTVVNSNTAETFCFIQAAIDSANTLDGHTLQVSAGTYQELLDITKSITLQGAPGTVIQPNENIPDFTSNHAGAVIWVQAHDVTIQDLEIDGDNPNTSGGYAYGGADINAVRGIYMNGAFYNNTHIENVTLHNLGRGVNLYGGQNHVIHNSSAQNLGGPADNSNYGYGILLMGNSSATITNNTVNDAMTAGIFMQNNHSASNTLIAHNNVTNARIGLGWNMLYGGATGIVENNTVSNAELGMQVTSITNGYLEIRNNAFTLPTGADETTFSVWNTAPNMVLITGNTVQGGDFGVYLHDDNTSFGLAQAHLWLTDNAFEGTETAVEVSSNSASHTVTLRATGNTIENGGTGLSLVGEEPINNLVFAGNILDNIETPFYVAASGDSYAYANNITNFTTGVENVGGDINGRHNWWGAHDPADVNDSDAYGFRLGAAVVTWVDGTGSVSLADAIAGDDATFAGNGALVIVNHGSGQANAPFGKGIPNDTGVNQCADFYDFFAIDGSGSYNISIPVDSACTAALIDDKLFQFALDGDGLPDATCTPDAACWGNIAATRTGDVLTAVVDETDVLGTPFAAPSRNNNDPTAVSLQSFAVHAGQGGALTAVGLTLLTGLSAFAWRRRKVNNRRYWK